MWVFYHDVVSTTNNAFSMGEAFASLVVFTGIIVMAPSYFERRKP